MKKHLLLEATILFLVVCSVSLCDSYAAQAKPIELRFSTMISTEHHTYRHVIAPFAKELEERTNGRVKIVVYPSETLGKAKDHYDMIFRGIADMATFNPAFTPGRFPLTSVMELPLNIPTAAIASRVTWELYEKYMQKEYADIKLLWLATTDPAMIHTSKKLIKTTKDLKGLRVGTAVPQRMAVLRTWGASPANVTTPDFYDTLQKGMIDGVFLNFSGVKDFRLGEQLKYSTAVRGGGITVGAVGMNLRKWNSLPPDIQKIINEITGLNKSVQSGGAWDDNARAGIEYIKKGGNEIYDPPTTEKQLWFNTARPVCDNWVADINKKGLPGKMIYEDAVSLLQKYEKDEASGRK